MTIRTTVAFDPATASRLERLAKRWRVSKSEALRRALEQADREPREASAEADFESMSPLEIFRWIESHPLVSPEEGAAWLKDVEESREDFARRGEENDRSWSTSTRTS